MCVVVAVVCSVIDCFEKAAKDLEQMGFSEDIMLILIELEPFFIFMLI